MATDINLLMGEVVKDPDSKIKNVEKLLAHLLRSLLEEQNLLNSKVIQSEEQ